VLVNESVMDRSTTRGGHTENGSQPVGVDLVDEAFSSMKHSTFVSVVPPFSCQYLSSCSAFPVYSHNMILHLRVENRAFPARELEGSIDGLLGVMSPFPGPHSVIVVDHVIESTVEKTTP
jgi:hypothetical protein